MNQHFRTVQLVRYSAPSIATVFFTSVYGIVDGIFVANYAGTSAFAAVNIILPYVMILSIAGAMIGTGGSALVSKMRGNEEAQGASAGRANGNDNTYAIASGKDTPNANATFSLLIYFCFALGCLLAVVGWASVRPVSQMLGATGDLVDICATYGRILMLSMPFFSLQYAFEAFFPAAGKPKLGFAVIVIAGVTNIALDALLVGVLGWGVEGAAIATVISEVLAGFCSLLYFGSKNSSYFRLGRPSTNWSSIGKACANGLSEMVSHVSASAISMLYNYQMLRFVGENGVAAFGVVFYATSIFFPLFIGYNLAVSPILSYQYGSQNKSEMRSILVKSLRYVTVCGLLMAFLGQVGATTIASLFSAGNSELLELTSKAFRLCSPAFSSRVFVFMPVLFLPP